MKFFFSLSFVFTLFLTSTSYGKSVVFSSDYFCPYVCDPTKEDGKTGYTVEILKEIFESTGYDFQFKILPWQRALIEFNNQGDGIDSVIGVTKEHDVSKSLTLFPEIAIGHYDHRFYTQKGSTLLKGWRYKNIESVRNLTLGTVAGWSYCNKEFTKYTSDKNSKNISALRGKNIVSRNFMKLVLGRNDLWVVNISTVEYFLNKERKKKKNKVNRIVTAGNLPCTGFIKAYPIFYQNDRGRELSNIYYDGMKKIRKSGSLNEILKSYGISDWLLR